MRYRLFHHILSLTLLLCILTGCRSHRVVWREEPPMQTTRVLPAADRQAQRLYREVESWLGVPYRTGGNDKRGVDCSGFICQVYRNVYGKQLHRRSMEQYSLDIRRYLNGNDLRTGDLVFFSTQSNRQVNHVGIYLTNYKFVHASGSRGVVIDDLRSSYFIRNWIAGGEVK